jgi:hypothetical protein
MPEQEPVNDYAPEEAFFETPGEPVHDETLGDGALFKTADDQRLEVFRDAVRVTITLTGMPEPIYEPGWLGYPDRSSDKILGISQSGAVVYRRPAHPDANQPMDVPQAPPPSSAEPAAVEQQPPSPPAATPGSPERGVRVRYTGTITQIIPTEDRTNALLIVAEHVPAAEGTEDTLYHDVWPSPSISRRVVRLIGQDVFAQGVKVDISGYRHTYGPTAPEEKQGEPFDRAVRVVNHVPPPQQPA